MPDTVLPLAVLNFGDVRAVVGNGICRDELRPVEHVTLDTLWAIGEVGRVVGERHV